MTNKILDERYDYQRMILDNFKEKGFSIRKNDDIKTSVQRYALDKDLLMKFLFDTQPETMESLSKIYGIALEETILNSIDVEETKSKGSRLDVLKHGIEIANFKLTFLFTKPATSFNTEANELYEKNIFSVAEEVYVSEKERVDLVVFINGFAISAIELKSPVSGQNYKDAIKQFSDQRNPKTRSFLWKSGVLVCFAVDTDEVYMTTRLQKEKTFFMPFNKGRGEGIDTGKGNPLPPEGEFATDYMWKDIFTKETLMDIITKFMFIQITETKDYETDKVKRSETVIFPRYHQLDALRKILKDTKENGSAYNYLIQHSAGSGKTNTIAWLAHRLASLHNDENKVVFDNVIICTDRVVVDRQLQQAVKAIEHKSGMIEVMDKTCTSEDLANALKSNTKIIATTIQKFPYVVDQVKNLKSKTFAVIIDEAHSSTAGKNMAAVTKTLGNDDSSNIYDAEQMIEEEIMSHGKQPNISMFAFTATPKATTLALFGRKNEKGQLVPFHQYSMKQAIEEGYILDVLHNYVTYDTYFRLNKTIEDDPKMKTGNAKRQIARFIDLHEENIFQRIEIIIEHFREKVMSQLDGRAKAMVVTSSREAAIKYRQAFEKYVKEHHYENINALVAFSGKVSIDGNEYSESGINGFAENQLPSKFNTDEYNVLLVADKYQTGFDQPKLCAMYVLKSLKGVTAVQTLSRLNRICPPYDKKTFVLDFANTYEDITESFSKFYAGTILSSGLSPNAIYDIETKIDGYYIITNYDIDTFNKIFYGEKIGKEKKDYSADLLRLLKKAADEIKKFDDEKRKLCVMDIRHFIRFYDFLIQATSFKDEALHKKYTFFDSLYPMIKEDSTGPVFNLDGKLKATGFKQKKSSEHETSSISPNPVVKLPIADDIRLTPAKEEKLSDIIEEINSRFGTDFDSKVVMRTAYVIRDQMKKSDELKISAVNNTEEDFSLVYYDHIDDALTEGYSENKEFFSLLMKNEDLKRKVLGLFTEEIYNSLRKEESENVHS